MQITEVEEAMVQASFKAGLVKNMLGHAWPMDLETLGSCELRVLIDEGVRAVIERAAFWGVQGRLALSGLATHAGLTVALPEEWPSMQGGPEQDRYVAAYGVTVRAAVDGVVAGHPRVLRGILWGIDDLRDL